MMLQVTANHSKVHECNGSYILRAIYPLTLVNAGADQENKYAVRGKWVLGNNLKTTLKI